MPPVREHFEDSGNWLFRHRSFLPFIFLVPLIGQMLHFDWLARGSEGQIAWQIGAVGVSLFGLLIRVLTIGYVPARTSGRSTNHQVAESLNVTGMYSLVRNPLYIGNFFIWLGFGLYHPSWQVLLIFVLGFCLYYERIVFAEEAFLRRKFPQEFLAWAAKTPAMIPRLSGWNAPALTFCWKTALRREYRCVLGIAVMFFLLELFGEATKGRELTVDAGHVAVLLVCTAFYFAVRWFAKRRILHVEGR